MLRALIVLAAGLLILADGCTHATAPAKSAEPSLGLLDLDNQPVDFWRQQRGRVTVVLFTRTDCPISNRFAPEIRQLYELYHPHGVDFFLIYVDPREDADAIRNHLREYAYPCPGLRDPKHTLVAYCHATTTPEAVVFNKDRTMTYQGRINDRYVELGTARARPAGHDLADAIESTVLGRPVAVARTRAIGCSIADLKE